MKKPLLALPLLIMALLALVLAWAFLSYPADYVLRILRWGNADVYDYQKFPERVVAGSRFSPASSFSDGAFSAIIFLRRALRARYRLLACIYWALSDWATST